MSLINPNKKFTYWLTIISLIYVIIPSILFIGNWVKIPYAFSCILLIVGSSYVLLQNYSSDSLPNTKHLPKPSLLITSLLISFILCYISGAGEFVEQFFDYLIHNAKFHLLATEEWPLYNEREGVYMCYYLGYYVVPSVIGKWAGLASVKYFSFGWLWFGLFLTFAWIHVIFQQFSLVKRVIATCMVWSGSYVAILLPALQALLKNPSFIASNSVFIGTEGVMLHYSSTLKSIVEGPQHAITALLGGAMFMALGCSSANVGLFSLFTIATLFWSPFVTLGLAPFVLYCYYLYWKENGIVSFFKREVPVLFATLLGFLPLVFYTLGSAATNMKSNTFIGNTTASHPYALYVLFLFSAVGVWIVFFGKKLFRINPEMIWISYVSIGILALFQIGYFNDLNNRASVPGLLILGISISYCILSFRLKRPFDVLFIGGIIFWILNTSTVFKYLYEISSFRPTANTIEDPYTGYSGKDYYEFMENLYTLNSAEVIKQYSLHPDSFFQKYLLKK